MDAVLTSEQQTVIETLARIFAEQGKWPPYLLADKRIEREHGLDLREILANFPAELIWPDPRHGHAFSSYYQGEIELTTFGLALSEAGKEVFERFLAALRFIAERERKYEPESWDPPQPLQIKSEELKTALALDDVGLSQLYHLLRLEPHALLGSSGAPPGPWTITISREARRYREVNTAEDYARQRKKPHPADAASRAMESARQAIVAGTFGMQSATTVSDPAKVFVVYGRNESARKAMFDFLRSIGLEPMEWPELVRATGTAAPYIGEILGRGFKLAQAVVILLTPDDEGRLSEQLHGTTEPPYETQLTPQPRLNVIFEAGMAFASHPDRTVIVELGQIRPFSDIAGRHVVRLDNSSQMRQELAQRLERAGCKVDLSGTDWHATGDFENAVSRPIGVVPTAEEAKTPSGLKGRDSRRAAATLLVASFEHFVDTFLWRRRELTSATSIPRTVHDEYQELHRALVRDYARVRDDFIVFVESDPSYDLRPDIDSESPYAHPIDEPLTTWWRPLTFADALSHWSDADDAHLAPFLERQKAVLRAFADQARA